MIDPLDDYIATASNSHVKNSAEMLVDRSKDNLSKWSTDDSVRHAWIQVDLRQPRSIDAIIINEANNSHITRLTIDYKKGDEWVKIGEETKIGSELTIKFKKLTTQFIRLNILDATVAPALLEVDVHEADH